MNRRDWPFLLITAFLVFGMGIRLAQLQGRVREPVPTPSEAEATAENLEITEDARLFNELLEESLIAPKGKDGRLAVADSDLALVRRATLSQGEAATSGELEELERLESLLRALYRSPAGSVVRSEVRRWNETRRLSAVRDNRPAAFGDTASRWKVVEPENPDWRHPRIHDRVPESYGYVNLGELRPGFSDWRAAFGPDRPAEFRTTLELQTARNLVVQVVGRPTPVEPPPQKIEPCFPPSRKTEDDEDPQPDAFRLHYALPAGTHTLRLNVGSVVNPEPSVEGLRIRKIQSPPGFQWRSRPPGLMVPDPKPIKILTADGQPLTDAEGNPTELCQRLGLLPVTGLGARTPYALWGILSRSHLPATTTEVRLAIDGELQAIAQETLEKHIAMLFGADEFADVRRAALVLLGAETGAILAAATHPRPPTDAHPWDLAAFAKVYPVRNPMLVRGWQGLDENAAPGSTFKMVTALAAMDGLAAEPEIGPFLEGFSQREFAARSGLSLGCAAYDPVREVCGRPSAAGTIANFKGIPVRRSFVKNAATGMAPVLGLPQAVRDSLNVWFVRLAMLVDGQAARTFDRRMETLQPGMAPPPFPELQIVRTARRLGFGDTPMDLSAGAPENVRLARTEGRRGREGDVLSGGAGRLDAMNPKARGIAWIVGQNAIGQAATASPLQMARITAAVRTGELVHPHLISRWGEDVVRPPEPADLGIDRHFLGLLQQGMAAVPQPGGTAARAFRDHPLRDHVGAKTGTANVAVRSGGRTVTQKRFFTSWLAGWAAPPGERPLAFACMITHARQTGGREAAPVVAEVLEAVAAPEEAAP